MFKTPNDFSIHIENMVREDKTLNYVDAILKYCDDNDVEIEDVKSLISKPLKNRLKNNYIDMNYLKSTTVKIE